MSRKIPRTAGLPFNSVALALTSTGTVVPSARNNSSSWLGPVPAPLGASGALTGLPALLGYRRDSGMPTSFHSGISSISEACEFASRITRVSASITRMASLAVLIRLRYFSSELRVCFSTANDRPTPIISKIPLAIRVTIDSTRSIQRAPSLRVDENSSSSGVTLASTTAIRRVISRILLLSG